MNFKMKMLAVAAAMVVAGSANAASTGAATTGSSLVFSAWDANGSYSLDLGTFLNTYIGADVATSAGNGIGNLLTTGTSYDFALSGFNLTSGSWNLAASDTSGRYRMLISSTSASAADFTGVTNSQVRTAASALNTYIGFGAAASTTTGTLAANTDLWYADGANWNGVLNGNGFASVSNDLTKASNLFGVSQTGSGTQAPGTQANFVSMTDANGGLWTAQVMGLGTANAYLHIASAPIAAVPEADTYAMFLAGLGLMGFVARRRTQA